MIIVTKFIVSPKKISFPNRKAKLVMFVTLRSTPEFLSPKIIIRSLRKHNGDPCDFSVNLA